MREFGECIWEMEFKNETQDLKVAVYEDLRHVCYKLDYSRYLISYSDFKSGIIQQRVMKNITSAFGVCDIFCDAAEKRLGIF